LCTGDIRADVVGRSWYKNCKKKIKRNHENNTSYHRAIRERGIKRRENKKRTEEE